MTGVMRSAEGADRLQTGPPKRRCVCFWHLADMPLGLTNVRYGGKSGHDAKPALMSANDPKRTVRASSLRWYSSGRQGLCELDPGAAVVICAVVWSWDKRTNSIAAVMSAYGA